jgi:hypothetical protein
MSKPQSAKPFFDPDSFVTELHQALCRDLSRREQELHAEPFHISNALLAERLIKDFRKKYQTATADNDKLEAEAFASFRSINNQIRRLKFQFPDPKQPIQRRTPVMDKIHLRARAIVHFVLGRFDIEEFFEKTRHSAGSSIGVPFTDTSLESKFSLPWSITEGCKSYFLEYLNWDTNLCQALASSRGDSLFNVVSGSRATTVDKTDDKRRFIAVEPTCNMFMQQGLMSMMYDRFSSIGLNLESLPDEHRRRAWISSITLNEATIDWSSASDSVSIGLLSWLLPQEWLSPILQTRSPVTQINESWENLAMFATMGNACTFPLETLVFWAYGHAVRLSSNPLTNTLYPEWEEFKCVSVFGDDCIVPTELAEAYIEVLTSIGFTINKEKSFYGTYPFRESCGGDYYRGYDVRPYYIKRPVSTRKSAIEPWLYIITNLLSKKLFQLFGGLKYIYTETLYVLGKAFSDLNIEIKVVPSDFPDDSGLKVICDLQRFWKQFQGCRWAPIRISKHGTVKFQFCRFQYWTRLSTNDDLRYWKLLKSNSGSTLAVPEPLDYLGLRDGRLPDRRERKRGGYVVASGLASYMDVPRFHLGRV